MEKLDSTYMRICRGLAGHQKHSETDIEKLHLASLEARKSSGRSSIDSYLRFRRLCYIPRILDTAPEVLRALLTTRVGGEPLQWVKMVRDDLRAVAKIAGHKVSSLGDPLQNSAAWQSLMLGWPREWKSFVPMRPRARKPEQ